MEKKQTLTLLIDDSKVKILKEFLKTLDYVHVQGDTAEEEDKSNFQKGTFKATDKLSDYAGIWTGEKRDLKKIRAKAWRTKR